MPRFLVGLLIILTALSAWGSSSPIHSFESFSSLVHTSEKCSGYKVNLRINGEKSVTGALEACRPKVGDTSWGPIKKGTYDPKSGALSFDADLSMGTDHTPDGAVPSQDHYHFEGHVRGQDLIGTLTHTDLVYPKQKAKVSHIHLKKG